MKLHVAAIAVVGLFAVMPLAGCGAKASLPPEAPEAPPGLSDFHVPEQAPAPPSSSFSAPLLDRLDADMKRYVDAGQVANLSYALVKDGEWVRARYFGSRLPGSNEPVNEKTIYRIYSMTKAVTAVALLMLYEEGEFSLDDPVTRFVPELDNLKVQSGFGATTAAGIRPVSRPPTMGELLTHTAGFAYNDGKPDYAHRRFIELDVDGAATNEEYLRRLARVPLMYEPGTAWSYSAAFDIQGIIVERISGERLGAFMKRRIFDPLGMEDTGFSVSDTQRSRLAALTGWTPGQPLQTQGGPVASMDRSGLPRDAGGHGLVSTLSDYVAFAEMLLNDGRTGDVVLLKPETVEILRTNAVNFTDPDTGYPRYQSARGAGFGFGVGVVTNTIQSGLGVPEGSYYWDGAAGTWFWIDPRHKIVFVGLLQNLSPNQLSARRTAMVDVSHALFTDYFPAISDFSYDTPN